MRCLLTHPRGQIHQVHVDEGEGLGSKLVKTSNGSSQGEDLSSSIVPVEIDVDLATGLGIDTAEVIANVTHCPSNNLVGGGEASSLGVKLHDACHLHESAAIGNNICLITIVGL